MGAAPGWAAGAWSLDADCAACHAAEAAALDDAASPHASLACITCHNDETALTDVHKDADASSDLPKKLKKAKIGAETCLACHGDAAGLPGQQDAPESDGAARGPEDDARKASASDADAKGVPSKEAAAEKDVPPKAAAGAGADAEKDAGWGALAALTADSEALVDAEGTVVNPHALPEGSSHEAITCTDCHKVHAEADPAKAALGKCRSCHHEDVFECYTCHD